MSYSYYSKDELNKLLKDDANEIINSIYDDHYKIFRNIIKMILLIKCVILIL